MATELLSKTGCCGVGDKTFSRLFRIYIIEFANLTRSFKFLRLEAHAITFSQYIEMGG